MMAPRPAQPSRAIAAFGSPRSRGATRAKRPPTASSHALVGSEKKAHGWLTRVNQVERAREHSARSAIAARTAENRGRAVRCGRRPVPLTLGHQTREVTKRSAGHTR